MVKITAILGNEVIRESTDQYKIDGWVNARFVNTGDAPVEIQGVIYNTNDWFDASVGNAPVNDVISIVFDKGTSFKNRKVVVNYGVYVSEDNSKTCINE